MKHVKCLVLMPAGPGILPEFVQDTVDSVDHYMSGDVAICLVDDTPDHRFATISSKSPLIYLRSSDLYTFTDAPPSSFGPLWLKELRALLLATREWSFDTVLRLDTDALVTGFYPNRDATDYFATNSDIGAIGAFTKRGDGSSKGNAFAEVGDLLSFNMSFLRNRRALVRNPVRIRTAFDLRGLVARAKPHGYVLGYTCTAAGLFFRSGLIERWRQLNLDKKSSLRFVGVGDDVLFGLCTYAAGFQMADAPEGLMAINWQGLPMPAEEIASKGIKLVHPVKTSSDVEQAATRTYFKGLRGQD